ncbi:MarR family winged helix-turn-helix transcriptional regulator [Bacillus dakarensis]|uniref:MarR family winged helix-turn-helix transcriptional regulator n=1 Tax=Robertmurraya dakarensis TaxID=1926278 RepID=UPI0009808C86|nr:MarR family transcriptional regulator [Bacillus dakarensis]
MKITLDKSIGAATVRLSKKVTRIINHHLKPYCITTEQWSVLRTLYECDHITQKQLSERSDKDQATLTKILDLLVKNGFVERIPNPNDRRSFFIKITEKGSSLSEELIPFLENIYGIIIEGIPDEKLTIFQEVLVSLEDSIQHLLDHQTERRN